MDGIILLHKPKGLTSHDCVNKIRRIMKTKKVGHTGTLDPSATGVLPICINDATKIIQFMEFDSKEYIAEVSLSHTTTTEDADGAVLEEDLSFKHLTREKLQATLKQFLGKQKQIPPMISSIKVNGKKLYQYARENKEVERPIRDIEVLDIELLDDQAVYEGTEIVFRFRAHVSKGTYIRTLAVDIGKVLGYPAHLKSLIRSKSGQFKLKDCVRFEDLESGNVKLVSIYEALRGFGFPMLVANDELKQKIFNGQKLPHQYGEEELVFIDENNHVLAIYRVDEKNQNLLKPTRVLINK
jgi:tRNA pseudouridine55 synthase